MHDATDGGIAMAGASVGTKAIVGLLAGLAAGAALAASAQPALLAAGGAVEVAGTLWINAILMTILPLVVSKLVVSVAGQDDQRSVGTAGWKAVALFIALLTGAAAATAAIMPAVFARLPIDAAAAASLRAAAQVSQATAAPPTTAQVVLSLVPTNAVQAAAQGAIVPLLVFSVAFAMGASRIPRTLRDPLLTLFRAVDASVTVLLHWIIALSPYGVFALGLGLAMRVGTGIVGALAYYIVVSSVTLVVFVAALYLVVFLGAGVSPLAFGRAAGPAQVVAFGTHSSMASLPAMLEGAERRLGLSQTATGFVLPLALAVFKYSGPIWFVVVTYFVGRLYDVVIDPSRAVAIVIAAVVTSFAVGGVPSGAVVVVAPVLSAAGLPVEAIGILLAVDPIPNAFRTVANVTGMMAVTVLAGGRAEGVDRPAAVSPPPAADRPLGRRPSRRETTR
jgi:Na+/H+-dicarboxylate symporter